MPRLEREARSPTGQIFLIFLLVIGGERGRARTRVHDYYVSPSKRISSFLEDAPIPLVTYSS